MKILAQVLGICARASIFLAYQQSKRKNLLYNKLCADVCWGTHYLLLGGIAGMIPNIVGIFRELVFIHRENKKWANCILWPCLFIAINWGLGFMTFTSLFNILPIFGSTLVTISLWVNNPKLTKCISLPVHICFFVYDIFVLSYVGMLNEVIGICSIVITFFSKKGKDDKLQELLKSE